MAARSFFRRRPALSDRGADATLEERRADAPSGSAPPQGPVPPCETAPLAALFAALRRGERPKGDGLPPDPARADAALAELDRIWRSGSGERGGTS